MFQETLSITQGLAVGVLPRLSVVAPGARAVHHVAGSRRDAEWSLEQLGEELLATVSVLCSVVANVRRPPPRAWPSQAAARLTYLDVFDWVVNEGPRVVEHLRLCQAAAMRSAGSVSARRSDSKADTTGNWGSADRGNGRRCCRVREVSVGSPPNCAHVRGEVEPNVSNNSFSGRRTCIQRRGTDRRRCTSAGAYLRSRPRSKQGLS